MVEFCILSPSCKAEVEPLRSIRRKNIPTTLALLGEKKKMPDDSFHQAFTKSIKPVRLLFSVAVVALKDNYG